MVHRLLVALLLAYLAVAASYAQDYGSDQGEVNEHHFIRVWLDPTKMAVGERATLNVMVGVDSFFTGSTELALPAIERALVLQSQPAVNGGENLQGKEFYHPDAQNRHLSGSQGNSDGAIVPGYL